MLILAFMQWQINAKKTMILIFVVLGYIIYSHETGQSLTQFREEAVDSFDEAVGNSKYKERVVSEQMRPVESKAMVEGNRSVE
ncbi:MAG: hypothetical protein P8Y65_05255 [Campylobacterales bacterium]